jgi:hypothetical protein
MKKMTTTTDRLTSIATLGNTSVAQIFNPTNGEGLMKFCRELAVIMIRRHSSGKDAEHLRQTMTGELQATLSCTGQQAHGLVDIALEIIHARVHGTYRRSPLELSYLIATATGAVGDLSVN